MIALKFVADKTIAKIEAGLKKRNLQSATTSSPPAAEPKAKAKAPSKADRLAEQRRRMLAPEAQTDADDAAFEADLKEAIRRSSSQPDFHYNEHRAGSYIVGGSGGSGPSSSSDQTAAAISRNSTHGSKLLRSLTEPGPLPSGSSFLKDQTKRPKAAPLATFEFDFGSAEAALLIALYSTVREGDQEAWAETGLSASDLALQAEPYYVAPAGAAPSVWYTKGLAALERQRFVCQRHDSFCFTVPGFKLAHAAARKADVELFDLPSIVANSKLKLTEEQELAMAAKRSQASEAAVGHAAAKGAAFKHAQPTASTSSTKAPRPSASASTSTARLPPVQAEEEEDDVPFQYYFVSDTGERVDRHLEADSKLDANNQLIFKIEYRIAQRNNLIARYIIDKERRVAVVLGPEGPTEYGYISTSKVNKTAPGFAAAAKVPAKVQVKSAPVAAAPKAKPPLKHSASAPAASTSKKRPLEVEPSYLDSDFRDAVREMELAPYRLPQLPIPVTPIEVRDCIIFRPDEYDIVLLVDHRERKSVDRLEKVNGLLMEARTLAVADFLWQAFPLYIGSELIS